MEINNKRKILMVTLITAVAITVFGAIYAISNRIKVMNDTVTLEIGTTLDLKVNEILKADEKVLAKIEVDESNVDTTKVGSYDVVLNYKNREFIVFVEVVDTTAPNVKMKGHYVLTNDVNNVVLEDLYELVEEHSEFNAEFLSFEKESDLRVMKDEDFKLFQESLQKIQSQEVLAEKKTDSMPQEEGIYRAVVEFKDIHDNAYYHELYVVLDKTAPVIEKISDITIEANDLNKKPEVDIKDYTITDNVDGAISGDNVKCELKLSDNDKKIYINTFTVTDKAGNVCKEEFKITMKKKKVVTSNPTTNIPSNNGNSNAGVTVGPTSSGSIGNFPVVYQMPELPTGCEVTALTMLMNYYGYPVSKTTMANNYLPKVKSGYTGKTDLDYYFCGDPFGTGIGCGAGALVTAANGYFANNGGNHRAADITGSSPSTLYKYVESGKPVVVMVTIGMANRKPTQGWYTSGGKYVSWSENDHGMVLIGCSSDKVKVACPLSGIKTYSRTQFEKVYNARGNRAMIIQ